MAERGKREKTDMGELNIVPIMALMTVLIPVLLFAFTFFEVKIQAVQAPKMGTGKAKKKDDKKKPLNLTVFIKKDGFSLKMQTERTTEPEPMIPMRQHNGEEIHDYAALYTRLEAIKDEYKDEKTINIGGEMDIPWQILARTIDCARVRLKKSTGPYTDLDKYMKAEPETRKDAKGKDQIVQLFPAVVFVVAE